MIKFNLKQSIVLPTIFMILACSIPFSCKDDKPASEDANKKGTLAEKREVEPDTAFGKLLITDQGGVTGADGVISFPLSNGESVYMMGDSFLSEVTNGKRDPESKMINNTFIVVDDANGKAESIYKGTLEQPETMLRPKNAGKTKEYYWPGHGFEHEGILHVFMSKFWDDPSIKEGWKFKFRGTDYLRLKPDSFEILSQEDFPYTDINGVHYGHSLLEEEDYTYIYGSSTKDNKATLHVARAKMDESANKLKNFEFFDGADWVSDAKKSNPLKGITKNVPEQFSVFKYNDKYILVMQERELFAGNIYSYTTENPTGPWKNETLLYHTTEQTNEADKLITYNAMAHPQYMEDGTLLISYCVNSLDVANIHENVAYYRPVFIRVPMEMILDE